MTEATKAAARSPEDKQLAEELLERARARALTWWVLVGC